MACAPSLFSSLLYTATVFLFSHRVGKLDPGVHLSLQCQRARDPPTPALPPARALELLTERLNPDDVGGAEVVGVTGDGDDGDGENASRGSVGVAD